LNSEGFGWALAMLRDGRRLSRSGWNARGQFVVLQDGYPDGIAINANTPRATGIPQGTVKKFRPYLMRSLRRMSPGIRRSRRSPKLGSPAIRSLHVPIRLSVGGQVCRRASLGLLVEAEGPHVVLALGLPERTAARASA
jgi:Protein of unknown function (DUF2829)